MVRKDQQQQHSQFSRSSSREKEKEKEKRRSSHQAADALRSWNHKPILAQIRRSREEPLRQHKCHARPQHLFV
eukprot:3723817-Rhodomonas_salina.1